MAVGERPTVTIRDVARAADVHVSTVSRALDPQKQWLIAEATRLRILEVVEELGYRPHRGASGLRRGQTRTIGVVVPDLGNPLYAPFLRGVARALDAADFMPLVTDTEDDHDRLVRILRHLEERRVEAVITTAAREGDVALLQQLRASGTEVVLAVRTLSDSGLPTVPHDDVLGGRIAVDHLLELGHRRIAQVQGPLDVEPFRARSQGCEDALAAAGLAVVARAQAASSPTVAEGERHTLELLRSCGDAPPTALFVQNDLLALGALSALRSRGLRCPEDVSVVSYNDAFFAAYTQPALTTVRLPAHAIGYAAGRLALRHVAGEDGDVGTSVQPELVVRDSAAAPATGSPPAA
ncbi:LacI family DNA-binding transcriptional regulator [Egicoccus sp. AB-alg6-2]|uniref:LacI family DNA-binding transcriptional regulator n=1 Tax=Egicoccus sp. AB-alg6-2 TaxID=3242692 RepID=UPI00359E967C